MTRDVRADPSLEGHTAQAHALTEPLKETSTSSLTQSEVEFAKAAGVPAELFDSGRAAAFKQNAARSEDDPAHDGVHYTTQQVAELLNRHPSTVRRMLANRKLSAVKRTGRQTEYPEWQFTSSGVLPHLREVIEALPTSYHARDVETVMTSRMEELDDHSPREWLEIGGDPTPLLEVLNELMLS